MKINKGPFYQIYKEENNNYPSQTVWEKNWKSTEHSQIHSTRPSQPHTKLDKDITKRKL